MPADSNSLAATPEGATAVPCTAPRGNAAYISNRLFVAPPCTANGCRYNTRIGCVMNAETSTPASRPSTTQLRDDLLGHFEPAVTIPVVEEGAPRKRHDALELRFGHAQLLDRVGPVLLQAALRVDRLLEHAQR